MKVSIVIPTYNRSDVLINKTLPAFGNQAFDKNDYEIIVIDDGSTDTTLRDLNTYASQNSNVRVYSQQNAGPAKARNLGIKASQGEIVIIVGDDTYPPNPDYIVLHYEYHRDNPQMNVALLGLTVWCPEIETPFMSWLQRNNKQFDYSDLANRSYARYDHLYTSNISFKRSYLNRPDLLLDERYSTAAFEDLEWGFRLFKYHSLKIFYLMEALLYHYHHYDVDKYVKRTFVVEDAFAKSKYINPEFHDDFSAKREQQLKQRVRFHKTLLKYAIDKLGIFKLLPKNMNIERVPEALWPFVIRLKTMRLKHDASKKLH